jgi:hypothetical protein
MREVIFNENQNGNCKQLIGTLISVLAANPKIAGEFYAVNNCGIFCSTDSGISWNVIDGIQWPKEYLSQHPRALAIKEDR